MSWKRDALKTFENRMLRSEAEFFDTVLDKLRKSEERLEEKLLEEIPPENEEYATFLEDEWLGHIGLLTEAAEILMVAQYHWVERRLKRFLGKLGVTENRKLDVKGIKKKFGTCGIDLEALPGYSEVNLLRLFCNSWKHNPSEASKDLCDELRVKGRNVELSVGRGHLDSWDLSDALRTKLGIEKTDQTNRDLVHGFGQKSLEFLVAVAHKVPG